MKSLWHKPIVRKLKSTRGESLVEVLVAVVVGGLATLMLAMGISVCANVNANSDEALDEYFAKNTAIVEGAGNDAAIPAGATGTGKGTATLQTRGDGATGQIASTQIDVVYTSGEQVNGETIVSYEASSKAEG